MQRSYPCPSAKEPSVPYLANFNALRALIKPFPSIPVNPGFKLSIESAVLITSAASDCPWPRDDARSASSPLTIGALNDVPHAAAYFPPGTVETTKAPGASTDTADP